MCNVYMPNADDLLHTFGIMTSGNCLHFSSIKYRFMIRNNLFLSNCIKKRKGEAYRYQNNVRNKDFFCLICYIGWKKRKKQLSKLYNRGQLNCILGVGNF